MHEMGLCDALVDAVIRRAGERRVRGVRVRIGGHPVDPEVIDQGFRLAAAGTVAADAWVEVTVEPLAVRCNGCGRETASGDTRALAACARCGGVDVEATGRDDVVLESITVDDPDGGRPPAASAPTGAQGNETSPTGGTEHRE
jgi:hydrogenase nickel incorporation protein HypA/HybF